MSIAAIFDLATSRIAAVGYLVLLLGAGIVITVDRFEIHSLSADNAKLDNQINNEKTGYKVRLSQAEANTATLTAQIADSNQRIANISAEGDRRLMEARQQVDVAQKATVAAQKHIGAILAFKPTGADACARAMSVDQQFMESLQ